jgi:polyhydroxybutyrate depolymerase
MHRPMNANLKLLVLFTLVPACGAPAPDEDDPVEATEAGELAAAPANATPFNTPGTYRHRMDVDGVMRETLVYVPEAARGARPAPVVFMLHGTSGDGAKFYNISGWREKADAEGLIAVFPSALTHCLFEDDNLDGDFDDAGEMKVTTKWAAGKLGDPARMPLCTAEDLALLPPARRALADHPLADDMAFFHAMVDRMPRRYSVDAKRMYASGFSNGGSMTSRLAQEMADRFAAIGVNAGNLELVPAVPAARPISVVQTVGEKDDRFLERLGIPALPLDETLLDIPAFRATVDAWLILTQLGPAYTYTAAPVNGRVISSFLHGSSNTYTLQVIEGLFHQYPNGTNHPVVMADLLWDFFSTQSLP